MKFFYKQTIFAHPKLVQFSNNTCETVLTCTSNIIKKKVIVLRPKALKRTEAAARPRGNNETRHQYITRC